MTTEPTPATKRTRSLSKGYVDLIVELREKPDTVFDVIIVGSGYGGSIAAQQLAGLRNKDGELLRIAVLERGSEYLPGMFPSTFAEMPKHVRFATQATGKVTGELEGLYDIRLGDDVNALVANGLGGGSLINAGVLIEPDFTTFTSDLPPSLVAELTTPSTKPNSGEYLKKAKKLLLQDPLNLNATSVFPAIDNTIRRHTDFDPSPNGVFPLKFNRLEDLATGGKRVDDTASFEAAEISVALQLVEANEYSIKLNACVACGDCMTGCNVGAKASLNTNLLAQAKRDGVNIYTGASVLSVQRMVKNDADLKKFEDKNITKIWQLNVVHTSLSLRKRSPSVKKLRSQDQDAEKPLVVRARHVILAAGTFGSTEILLRSRSAGLVFSNKLGEGFSCNGDNIAAIHGMPLEAKGAANEFDPIATRQVGPTITGTIKVPKKGTGKDAELGYLIQEFAVPAPLKRIFEELVTTTKLVNDLPTKDKSKHGKEHEKHDEHDPCAVNPDTMKKTLLLGIIGHDDAKGVLKLPLQLEAKGIRDDQEGALQIVWPEASNSHHLGAAFNRLDEYRKKAFQKATLISNPVWRFLPANMEMIVKQERGPVLTVHPLGGCVIGINKVEGVVDEYGQVFDAGKRDYDDWEGTLMVLDGAIIPGSLGANPSLTISAIALRGIEHFINEKTNEKAVLKDKWSKNPASTPKDKLTDQVIFEDVLLKKMRVPEATEIKVTERLSGNVTLLNVENFHEDYVVELTLIYEPKVLYQLMSKWGTRTQNVADGSYLRLFKAVDWESGHQLRVADDGLREKYVVWKADVGGNLDFFGREKKIVFWSFAKTACALALNRGMRDVWSYWFHKPKEKLDLDAIEPTNQSWLSKKWRSLTSWICEKAIFLSALYRVIQRASEVRTFKYELIINANTSKSQHGTNDYFEKMFVHKSIKGEKRLTYNRRANPWSQMLEMRLSAFPCMHLNKSALIKVDTRFLANQSIALTEISKQENQMNALLDMASFGLFMARVIFNNHILSFRMPDAMLNPTVPKRLPGPLNDMPDPEITEITVVKKDNVYNKPEATVRLTRYRGKSAKNPVAFIHGYSANGTTFAHTSLKPSIAEFLWKNGTDEIGDRDVWIIDLRTSSGMPTATQAWSYEDVALVDIPTALLHIKNVTGQKVDVVAHCVGAAMLSMAILTRASDIKTNRVQLGAETFILDEQLGILSSFNGDGRFSDGQAVTECHPTINAIVMSQKGPLIRYTEENIFRAYMMKYLQRWIAPEGYAFRTSDTPNATEQLINRLLSTLPYSADEYDVENPKWPCARTEWVTSRHRMDALYGRAFNAANMTEEALNCIDDFFGPMNMETLLQTIHFVRFNCITNQRGRGEFVSLKNLKDRWHGIPTFSIHGGDNGMVDRTTYELIQANFVAAGIPYAGEVYKDYGHQDLFIGKNCDLVFKDIRQFLYNPKKFVANTPVAQPAASAAMWHIDTPWIGPRLQVNSKGDVQVLAMSSPKFGESKLLSIPMTSTSGSTRAHVRDIYPPLMQNETSNSQQWHTQTILNRNSTSLAIPRLILMAYKIDQTYIDPANHNQPNFTVAPASRSTNVVIDKELKEAIDAWLGQLGQNIDHCYIDAADVDRLRINNGNAFNFVLASCQYPPGVMDKKMSEESMEAIKKLIDKKDKETNDFVDFAIFAGDQIYADATAGLMDPTRTDERLDLPYEVALRSKPLQEIMRRVPVHMLLDDHEIVDNWEPLKSPSAVATENSDRRKGTKVFTDELAAYWKYQRGKSFKTKEEAKTQISEPVSYAFDHGEAAFYMLDTRTKREYRPVGKSEEGKLISPDDMKKLRDWLVKNKDKVKFIIASSILLPRKLALINQATDEASQSDSWDGYPASMKWLLDTIVVEGITNTIFLSGDEHLSCVAKITLEKYGMKAEISSVHASGLYAPYPFANAKEADFIQGSDSFEMGDTKICVDAKFADIKTRFAKILVGDVKGKPTVKVEFHSIDGVLNTTPDLLS